MQWYYSENGQQAGPVSEEELKSKIVIGKVKAEDLVWHEGMADWLPVSKSALATSLTSVAIQSPMQGGVPAPRPQQASPYQPPAAQPLPATSPYGVAMPPPEAGKATASMVLGICGLVFWCIPCIGLILGILAVVFSYQITSLAQTRADLAPYVGRAGAGKIMGIITIVLSILYAITSVVINVSALDLNSF